MKSNTIIAVIVTALVAGAVGFVAGDSNEDPSTSSNQDAVAVQTVDSPAANLRVSLNNALREHVNLSGVALRNLYVDAPDLQASLDALDQNSQEVAGLVGSVYGEDAGDQFLALWRDHINFFAEYTTAAKNDDETGMQEALDKLAGYSDGAAAFFASANPNLTEDAVKSLLSPHKDLVIETIDLIDAGEFGEAYLKLGEAADQANDIADGLAGAIEAQFPEMY